MIRPFRCFLVLALLLGVASSAVARPPAPPPPAAAPPSVIQWPAAPPADLDAYVSRVLDFHDLLFKPVR